jgi:hypothetical protein
LTSVLQFFENANRPLGPVCFEPQTKRAAVITGSSPTADPPFQQHSRGSAYGNTAAVVCFGYPEAHEDDPERAVRAALELVATVLR